MCEKEAEMSDKQNQTKQKDSQKFIKKNTSNSGMKPEKNSVNNKNGHCAPTVYPILIIHYINGPAAAAKKTFSFFRNL